MKKKNQSSQPVVLQAQLFGAEGNGQTFAGPSSSSDHIDGILLDVEVREAIRQFDEIVRRATTDLMEVITRTTAGKLTLMMRGLTGGLTGLTGRNALVQSQAAATAWIAQNNPTSVHDEIIPDTIPVVPKKTPVKSAPAPAPAATGRRPMSPEARQRIIDAQKKRWAKVRRAKKQEQQVAASKLVKKAAKTPAKKKAAVKKTVKTAKKAAKPTKPTKPAKPTNPPTPFPVKPSFASLS